MATRPQGTGAAPLNLSGAVGRVRAGPVLCRQGVSMSGWSLRRRMICLLSAAAVLLAVLAALVAVTLVRDRRIDDELRSRALPASQMVSRLLASLVDQETGARGYVLTGDDAFLEPYRRGQLAADRDLKALELLLGRDPEQRALVTEIETASQAWRRAGPGPEIVARQAGRFADAQALVAAGAGKRRFDVLRQTVARLDAAVAADQDRSQRWSVRSANRLTAVLGTGAVLAAALLLLLAVLLPAWILRPLQRLRTDLRQVAGGALTAPLRPDGPPELRALAADADLMRRRIVTELDASRAATEALAQRGAVVSGLSEQLAPSEQPVRAGLALAGALHVAEGVLAGDWYDVIDLPDGTVVVLVVDVSGHGAGAGLVAARLKAVLPALLQAGLPLEQAVRRSRDQIQDPERFASLLVLQLDLRTSTLRWVNAGHPPALLLSGRGERTELVAELEPTGPLLSPLLDGWSVRQRSFGAGETVLCFTDGLIEARDDRGREFGQDGILAAVRRVDAASPEAMVQSCVTAASRHSTTWRRDDVTVVAVTRAAADAPFTVAGRPAATSPTRL